MSPDQVIQYLKRFPGVAGTFLSDFTGDILALDLKSDFDDQTIKMLATDGRKALEMLRTEMPDCYELCISTTNITILLHAFNSSLLFILVDRPEEVAYLQKAARVTSKRYNDVSIQIAAHS